MSHIAIVQTGLGRSPGTGMPCRSPGMAAPATAPCRMGSPQNTL